MRYILSIAAGMMAVVCNAQTQSENYVLSRTYKQTGAGSSEVNKVVTTVQYIDGLGRPSQKVAVGRSTAGTDLVTAVVYDAYGRVVQEFLPYAVSGMGTYQSSQVANQGTFYTTNVPQLSGPDLSRPYTQTAFDPSPLNRVANVRQPGNSSSASSIVYGTNATNEVKLYRYTSNADITQTISTTVGYYTAGKLTRVQMTDENGKEMVEYKDTQGRIVCRKVVASTTETLSTYYVYDDFGQLVAILQPEYQSSGSAANAAFLYEYDARGRMVAKKIPGVEAVNMIYDKLDRLVMFRDGDQRARGVWGSTKYDVFNRVAYSGEVTDASGRSVWQNILNNAANSYESKSATTIGYTFNSTPPTFTDATTLRVFYYDDYSFPQPTNLPYSATSAYYPSPNSSVKSLPTGSRVKMLPGNGTATSWLVSASYYDAEYRLIQEARQLYALGTDAIERISTQYKYDLAPLVSERKTEHTRSGPVTNNTHTATYVYDHADRLLNVKEKVSDGATTKEAFTIAHRYNVLGQLKQRWYHSADGTNFRRRTDYTDNIRGWQTNANTYYKQAVGGPDLNFLLLGQFYANGANFTNGNISAVQWGRKDATGYTAGASYTYDGANRLVNSASLNGNTHLETGITYDKNGNLLTLNRAGAIGDALTFSYTGAGNQITSVTDGSGNNTGIKAGTSSFGYNTSGNLITDGNRGLTIDYNQISLPKKITVGSQSLYYDYDAFGNKHKFTADTIALKYEGLFNYRISGSTNVLDRAQLTEGQAVYRNGSIKFEYYLKDYIGNSRVVFDETGKIVQKMDYYPFGQEIAKDIGVPLNARNGINRYNFIGRESQINTGYIDLKARFYDPLTGRFLQVDPQTEMQENLSVYQYGWNNPILLSDPSGRFPGCCKGLGDFTTGVIQSLTGNIAGASPISASPGYRSAYNAGRTVGDIASIVVGATEVAGAALIAGSSGALAVVSGGTLTPVAAAGAVGATALGAHGLTVAKNAMEGLNSNKGRVNAEGESTKYENKTGKESVPNRETDVTKSQFEKSLSESGYSKTQSKDGKVTNYEKGEKKYTVRDNAKSTGAPTADAYKKGELKTKIRLQD